MKKYLIFKTSEMAYESTRLFAESLGESLMLCGNHVDYFDVRADNRDMLESLPGNKYDSVIDFNSALPQLISDVHGFDEYFLDLFECPFINYIVDHPMYHHKNLCVPLKMYNIICIDDTHKDYVRLNYSNIKNVETVPLGYIDEEADCCFNVDDSSADSGILEPNKWYKRENRVLFGGTFLNPDDYLEIINQLPQSMKNDNLKMIDAMLANKDKTFEELVSNTLLVEEGCSEFPIKVQSVCFADIYTRAYLRQQVLKNLADGEIPLTVFGEKYDQAEFLNNKPNVIIKPQVSYRKSIQLMKDYRFVLNIMPWFKSGIHDRVVNGMHNGCACITDSSKRMDMDFVDENDYIGFDIDNIEVLPYIVNRYICFNDYHNDTIKNCQAPYNIALNGNRKVSKYSFIKAVKAIEHM